MQSKIMDGGMELERIRNLDLLKEFHQLRYLGCMRILNKRV